MTLQEAIASGKLFKLPRHESWIEVFNNEFVNSDTGLRVMILPSAVADNGWITKDKSPKFVDFKKVISISSKRLK